MEGYAKHDLSAIKPHLWYIVDLRVPTNPMVVRNRKFKTKVKAKKWLSGRNVLTSLFYICKGSMVLEYQVPWMTRGKNAGYKHRVRLNKLMGRKKSKKKSKAKWE